MNGINIGENIMRLRHERKIRQEELADFIGVTKASVSKWERGATMPDIALLPRLASFFDVTVDALIGYEPQLTGEQIQKLYQDFAAGFAARPFGEVMAETEAYVKRYYSCYPFLLQVGLLWLNHYMLADTKEAQERVLEAAAELYAHIEKHCRDLSLCDDAVAVHALIQLLLGRPREVIEALEEPLKPQRLMAQSGAVLAQAYMMSGDADKAESFTQISMYGHLLLLIADATSYLSVHMNEPAICDETAARVTCVEKAYAVKKLNPNVMAQFEYQAAVCYAACGKKEKALGRLTSYVECLEELFLQEEFSLHGDAYFNRLDEWLDTTLGTGGNAPRNRKIVVEDAQKTLSHPAFAALAGIREFEKLKAKVEGLV